VIGLVFLLFGLLFKIAAVPFHVWAPDVYEGSPTSVATFFAVVPKMVLLTVLLRVLLVPFYDLLDVWSFVIILSSLLSMVFSSIVALYQKRLKRFLAYSSIGHVGYLLIGVSCVSLEGIQAVFFYIIIYSIMSINLWTILLSLEQKKIGLNLFISQLGGLSQTNLFLSLTIAVSMFSALGLPPIAGFFAKMQIFLAAMASSLYLLGIIGVLSSVIGAFYYLRFVKILFFDPPTNVSRYVRIDYPKAIIISLTFFIITFIFIHPTPLLILTHSLSLELIF
jgi:NADH-quinone oxidoreductase subunit N